MKLGAHGPNRRTSGPRAQIMRKSIFKAESQFSWNWVLTAQIDAQAVPELRSWENQFLRPNRNFHEIGCSRPKSTHKRSPSSDHEKINFYGRIAIFMKLGAHGSNRRTSRPRAQNIRISIFKAELQFSWNWVLTAQIDAQAVPELRSWENQFLRPNRNFHEIGCSRPKSTHKRSPSSDHEKINAQAVPGRIAIFMKLGAHGPNRLTSGPRAQIMRKSIFIESQFSWNWVLTAQIDAQVVPELRTSEYQFLRPNCNFHEIGCSRPKSTHKAVPELRSWENQFLNWVLTGRIAIISWNSCAHGPNRLTSGPRAQIMRKSIFTAESQFSWNWVLTARIAIFMKLGAHGSNRRTSRPRAQNIRISIFKAESQFSWNWVLTAQIDSKAVPELRSWENQFLRPNRNFHEIGCSRPKSTHKRSPS